MQTLKTPLRKDERASDDSAVAKVVDEIISAVAADGDAAVARYSASLDRWEPERFRLTPAAIAASLERVPTQVLDDIVFCQEQVRTFAQAQRATMVDLEVETLPASGSATGTFPWRASAPTSPAAAIRWSPPRT